MSVFEKEKEENSRALVSSGVLLLFLFAKFLEVPLLRGTLTFLKGEVSRADFLPGTTSPFLFVLVSVEVPLLRGTCALLKGEVPGRFDFLLGTSPFLFVLVFMEVLLLHGFSLP